MKSYILNLVPIYMAIFISHKQFIINLLVLIINIDSFFNNSFFFKISHTQWSYLLFSIEFDS